MNVFSTELSRIAHGQIPTRSLLPIVWTSTRLSSEKSGITGKHLLEARATSVAFVNNNKKVVPCFLFSCAVVPGFASLFLYKMSRKRRSGFDFSVFYEKTNASSTTAAFFTCKTCKQKLISEQSYNLKRHITSKHPDVASIGGLTQENEELGDQPPSRTSRIWVKMERNQFLIDMVRWATECNLPMNFFSKDCVRNVLGPLEDALHVQRVTKRQIITYAEVVHDRIEKFITSEARGRLVCIKADLASRKGRSVLGINAQYVKDGKIIVRALGMIERFDRNTGQRLAEEILELLKRFSISIPNIYTFTTDNGSNFLKAGSILRMEQELSVSPSEEENSEETEPTSLVTARDPDER